MNGLVMNFPKESPAREKLDLDLDTDSDEEEQLTLEKAVKEYKKNRKAETVMSAFTAFNCETNEIKGSQTTNLLNKNTDNYVRECLNGNVSVTSDMQDLIKYFTIPKKDQKSRQETSTKTLSDYEKQGAIPKEKVRNASSDKKKIQAKVYDKKISFASDLKTRETNYLQASLGDIILAENRIKSKSRCKKNVAQTVKTGFNSNSKCRDGREKTYSRPFFYIVPEKPSANFLFPRGSYYVVPKAPDSSTQEAIIFHPESSTNATELSPNMKIDEKVQKLIFNSPQKLPKNMNNLGKVILERTDSHLNIGPAQVREESIISNLEASYNPSKVFQKDIISPKKSSVALDVAQKVEEAHTEGAEENEELFSSDSEESYLDYSNIHKLEIELTDNQSGHSSKKPIAGSYLQKQDPGGLVDVEYLDHKIQEQYERMVRDLPESRTSDLLDKCIEFQGNDEKLEAYIQENQLKIRREQLLTDLQYIFPDADPSFLLEEIEKLEDDDNAINILTDRLLDSQSYPKMSRNECEVRKKLWLTYVKKFNVKEYLLRVPKPDDFAGTAGDNNKAEEKLIFAFLLSRYPAATLPFMSDRFYSNSQNITKTCASMVGFQVVRLAESMFEHENFDEDFLKEICYIDHREEIDNYLKAVKEMKEIEAVSARLNGAFLYCPLCAEEELLASEAVTCPDGDVFCKGCIRRYVETKLGDATYKIACPIEGCLTFFTLPTLEEFLPENISSVIIKKQQAEEISTAEVDGLEFCKHCDYAYVPSPEDKVFKCQNPTCLAETCRICHEENHIPLRCGEIERQVDVEARKKIEETMTEELIRRCPTCRKTFLKIDGCNLIKCVCGTQLCYICTRIIGGHDHFQKSTCPMYSNNEFLHSVAVLEAGIQVKNEILKENPNIRILHDPTKSSPN